MSFKQAELWEAIQQPQAIRSETVPLMEEVAKRYPYFQLLHTLIAKAKHDRQTPDAYDALEHGDLRPQPPPASSGVLRSNSK